MNKKISSLFLTALCSILFLSACQSSFVYFPGKKLVYTPSESGIAFKSVFFNASDGIKLNGWFIPSEKSRGIVLYCHGNGGNISDLELMIKIYHEMHFSLFVFDYRGYGLSNGSPSEAGTYRDAEAAWNYLVSERKVNPENIIVHGRSLGGAIAAWLAAHRKTGLLIVESSFTNIMNVAKRSCTFTPGLLLLTYTYDAESYLKKVTCPVLIVHSRSDDLIPFIEAERLFRSANEPREFLEITGSHNTGIYQSINIYTAGLEKFLSRFNKSSSAGK